MQRFIFDTINTKKHNAGIRTFQSLRGGYCHLWQKNNDWLVFL